MSDGSGSAKTLRVAPERLSAGELSALKAADDRPKPPGWSMSPKAVALFLLGGKIKGETIAPKYFGDRRLIEVAVASLAADQAVLLVGPPGVAKSRVAEHLAAAISGDSGLLIQGTAGLDETQLRYGWNYAELLARGPSRDALTPTPLLTGLETGRIVRIEELTRIAPETQDALITVLSEKTLSIPELSTTVDAAPGFNIVATANLSDRGTNPLSAALRRRFNIVALPAPSTPEIESEIVRTRLAELGPSVGLNDKPPTLDDLQRLVIAFRELRSGESSVGDMTTAFGRPSGALSTADAIATALTLWSRETHFQDGARRSTKKSKRAQSRFAAPALAEAIVASAIAGSEAGGGRGADDDRRALRDYATTALAARGRDGDAEWAAIATAIEALL